MSDSPWSGYGRMQEQKKDGSSGADPLAHVISDFMRGRKQVQDYLDGVLREYHDIQSGHAGYRSMIDAAMTPSSQPESVEERLARLAREAQARRANTPPRADTPPRNTP
jgi:hypothetical protein